MLNHQEKIRIFLVHVFAYHRPKKQWAALALNTKLNSDTPNDILRVEYWTSSAKRSISLDIFKNRLWSSLKQNTVTALESFHMYTNALHWYPSHAVCWCCALHLLCIACTFFSSRLSTSWNFLFIAVSRLILCSDDETIKKGVLYREQYDEFKN